MCVSNSSGQYGIESSTYSEYQKVSNLKFKHIGGGGGRWNGYQGHILAITEQGELYCSGYNYFGQLGDGTTINRTERFRLGTDLYKYSAGGHDHSMLIKTDGTLWACGANAYGQLGTGNTVNYSSPVQIGTDLWKQVKCGWYHTQGLKEDGTIWVWGAIIFLN